MDRRSSEARRGRDLFETLGVFLADSLSELDRDCRRERCSASIGAAPGHLGSGCGRDRLLVLVDERGLVRRRILGAGRRRREESYP